jgi:chaperonin cofactor prefoldin
MSTTDTIRTADVSFTELAGLVDELAGRVEELETEVDALQHELRGEREHRGDLEKKLYRLQDEKQELELEKGKLERKTERLESETESLRERVDELQDAHDDLDSREANHTAGVHNRVGSLESRVESVEEAQSSDVGSAGDGPNPEFDTPLETVVSWADHVAEQQLSANKERARFVAAGIDDLATPVGDAENRRFCLSSRDIRQVVKVREERSELPRRETATRIIRFLDRLGKDAVEVRTNEGMKKVYRRSRPSASGSYGNRRFP